MMKKLSFAILLSASLSTFAATKLQKDMASFIDSIAGVYDSLYAPAQWKKQFANWNLQAESLKAKDLVLASEISLSEYHKIVNKLILSMKDYHVSVSFYATESASLPFTIRGTNDRYFFVYIDRTKLPRNTFPFDLGDELIEMGDNSVSTIVAGLKASLGGNTDETDQALAEMSLTNRRAARALDVPRGAITLKIKKAGKTKSHQLIWDYKKEEILPQKTLARKKKSLNKSLNTIKIKADMSTDIANELAASANASNNFGLGTRSSYLPSLGKKIWESSKSSHHEAYIYLNAKKEVIGYIRIPTYGASVKESKEFVETIKRFKKSTDKLVIDQLNNPGGSVFYLYSLVAALTDQPMATPKHYMSINQSEIQESLGTLKQLQSISDLETLKKAFGGDTISGYPLSLTFLNFMKDYSQFRIDEWNAGKKLTSPYHLYGVDKINPHPEVQYTKPILLLVNELDFSGGDFFPTIMQDNKRATIMGVRTAGAGGYVKAVDIPNQLGVGGFRYTGSLADRVDNTPIENLGVTPEIKYSLTVKDFQNTFKPFAKAVNEAIDNL